MKRRFHIAWMMMAAAAFVFRMNAAPLFHTRCLETLSKSLQLELPDSMGENVDNDSTWHFSGKPLRVRTNVYGDVSHIGYKLFDSQWAAAYAARPLLDFLERYALELDVPRKGVDKAEEAARKPVTFVKGNLSMLRNRTPQTNCVINEVERRRYTVEWEEGNQQVCLIVPADYQLFMGADAVELEQIFERDVKRMKAELPGAALPVSWEDGNRSRADSILIVSKGCYLSDQIRSDLYLYATPQDTLLLADTLRPVQTVNNILLTGYFDREIPLQLTVDKYGYLKSEMEIALQQLLAYCRMENCMLFLGIKNRTSDLLSVTLFAVNMKMAYSHTISLEFPFGILRGTQEKIKGRIYVYTPLQNITEKFFINDIKKN